MEIQDTTITAFDGSRDEVERLINDAERFEDIEDMIDRANLSRDEKAALWLLAWSEQPHRTRRQIVGEALTFAASPN